MAWNLTATQTSDHVVLGWANPATYVTIDVIRTVGGASSVAATINGTSTSYTDHYTEHGNEAGYTLIAYPAVGDPVYCENTVYATIPLLPPTIGTATPQGTNILVLWTNNDIYTHVQVYVKIGSGAWTYVVRKNGDETSYIYDASASVGSTLYFKVMGFYNAAESGYSGEASVTLWADTITESVGVSEAAPTEAQGQGVTVYETVGITETVTGSVAFSDTVTETLSVTDGHRSAQTIRIDYGYYFGSAEGKVYVTDDAYYSDNGVSIQSSWRSKTTDFSEVNPAFANLWKTCYMATVTYVDKAASTPMYFFYSTDGITWSDLHQNVGTGDGATKEAYFFFIKTGKMWDFKIEFPSANKYFQLVSAEISFIPEGETFVIA